MLTWGRRDDPSGFVDSDLPFVLFRLPIAVGPVWWDIGNRRIVKPVGGERKNKVRQGASGHAKKK